MKYLLPVFCGPSGAPELSRTICCRCAVLQVAPSGALGCTCACCCRCFWLQLVPALRCTICCRSLASTTVVLERYDVQFVPGVFGSAGALAPLGALSYAPSAAPALRCQCAMVPVCWAPTSAPGLTCTICCRCPGLPASDTSGLRSTICCWCLGSK